MQAELNLREQALFSDIFEVMKHYPDLEHAFGLWRNHAHFPLSPEETLHETSNLKARVSTTRVIKTSMLPADAFASQWLFDAKGQPRVTSWCCD